MSTLTQQLIDAVLAQSLEIREMEEENHHRYTVWACSGGCNSVWRPPRDFDPLDEPGHETFPHEDACRFTRALKLQEHIRQEKTGTVWRIVKLTNGRLFLIYPYQPDLFTIIKRRYGAPYRESTIDGQRTKGQVVDPTVRDEIEALFRDYFPPVDAMVEQTFTFSANRIRYESPTIDGIYVVWFSCESHSIRHPGIIKVVEDTLEVGGSRNSPTITGRLVLRVRVRKDAVPLWNGAQAEVE